MVSAHSSFKLKKYFKSKKEVAWLARIIVFLFAIGIILSNSHLAFAEMKMENGKKVSEVSNSTKKESNSSHSESKKQVDSQKGESDEMDMEMEMGDSHKSGDTKNGHEDDGSPNYKVLGTYGAVNLSFILIGVWNKWIRRKVV